jgi:hypothetical protein
MAERIKIDDTYTYEFDEGKVSILRHGLPWLSTEYGWGGTDASGALTAPKAWIAAANQITDLRAQVESLEERLLDKETW